jgi:hypothetical protein
MAGAEEVQTPPPGAPVRVVEPGKQMLEIPVIVGDVPTVRARAELQPPIVRLILAVPLDTPVTTPVAETVATAGAEEDQTPAPDPVSVSVEGIHNVVGPDGVMTGVMAVVPSTLTVKPVDVAYTVWAHGADAPARCVSSS